jgi:hypothetical protein
MTTSNSTRFGDYLDSISQTPVPLVPYSPKALKLLSGLCHKGVSPSGLFAAIGLAGPQSSQHWGSVQPGAFQFPVDHGPHFDIRNEWYYLACNLTYTDSDKKTQPLYLLLAIIRRGVTPPQFTSASDNLSQLQVVSCEATLELPAMLNPYYAAAAAIDGTAGDVTFQAPTASNKFQWSAFDGAQLFGLSSEFVNSMFPMSCGIKFNSGAGPVSVELEISSKTTTNPFLFLQGEDGCAPCIDGLGYRYYSWPSLDNVKGTVTVNGENLVVTGQAWLDHQWGARMQPLGYVDNLYARALGILTSSYPQTLAPQWDWFFMHLSNGMHITTAVLPSKGFDNPRGAVSLTNTTIVSTDSSGNMTYKTFQGGGVFYNDWVTVNCNLYASSWVLFWDTSDFKIDLQLNVLTPPPSGFSQGVDGQTFMEKGITVSGTVNGTKVTGVGFAEAVGYDTVQRQVINMLSQIVKPDSIPLLLPTFMPAEASWQDVTLSALLVIGPPVVFLAIIVITLAVVLHRKKRSKMQ